MKLSTLNINTDIIGMHLDHIELRPHNPEWIKIGQNITCELSSLLKDHHQKHFIEHVGSTAIPTIKAKPIIDVTIVTENDDDCRDIVCNSFPNTYQGSEWVIHLLNDNKNKVLFNVHTFHFTEKEWRYFFATKKYLIENPNIAQIYERVKFLASQNHPNDYRNYSYKKSNFLHKLAITASEIYRPELTEMVYQTFN